MFVDKGIDRLRLDGFISRRGRGGRKEAYIKSRCLERETSFTEIYSDFQVVARLSLREALRSRGRVSVRIAGGRGVDSN